jgi:hypothetical protein
MYMRETGFYTHEINPPKQHFLGRWLGSNVSTSDKTLFAKGTQAGQVQQQWAREIGQMNKDCNEIVSY